MIVGVFLKGYKTYKRTHFIPVSQGHHFSAYVGPNGAGKSSVLEALGTYFNEAEWIVNKSAKDEGILTNFINFPFVCPVFVVEKTRFADARKEVCPEIENDLIGKMSEYLWTVTSKDVASFQTFGAFAELRERLAASFAPETHYLLASGTRVVVDKELSPTHFGPFHSQSSFLSAIGITPADTKLGTQLERAKQNDASVRDTVAGDLNGIVRKLYDYIHIPSDVVIADFTKLETGTMQLLMGRNIDEEIRKAIPSPVLAQINKSLDRTVQSAVQGLDGYSYEKPKGGKKNITHPALAKLITREFFSIRELSWADNGGFPTPVSNLSSGEQRRALVDVAANYLSAGAAKHQNTIFAIDEPEISLHTSKCYDQFESLFDVAKKGIQTLITTHWYGFLPIAQEGAAHFLDRTAEEIACESYDLSDFKEKASKALKESKGQVPFDIALKSRNDLVQSIASSLRLPEPYSWILCEGSTEKIYLNHMLKEEIAKRRLRLLPLGGSGEVVRILQFLEVALSDKTFSTTSRVLAVTDTDAEMVSYTKSANTPIVVFKRLLLDPETGVRLVDGDSTTVGPSTAIEDVLNPEVYVETLRTYGSDMPVDIDSSICASARTSGEALDLRGSQVREIKEFFAVPGRKTDFARRYVSTAEGRKVGEPLRELILGELA